MFGSRDVREALEAVGGVLQHQVQEIGRAVTDARETLINQLTDVRADLRQRIDDTRRETGDTRAEVAEARREIATLRAAVEGWRAEASAARVAAEEARRAAEEQARGAVLAEPEPAVEAPPVPAPGPDAAEHEQLLRAAAGITYAEILCHRDTWAFVVEQAARAEHFRVPAAVDERADGTIGVDLSGRSVMAALDALWHTRRATDASAGTRALAERVYERVRAALDGINPADTAEDRAAVRIVIDDRRPAPATRPADGTQPGEPATA